MRISILQTDIVWENKQENLRRLREKLETLRGTTEIVVLPETFSTGFSMDTASLAEPTTGETIATLRQWSEESGELEFCHNPFSMPQGGVEALENQDPLEILAYQYDIVCNGVELSSGAVRNHDLEIMVKAFEIAGYTEEDLKEKFGALYNAFQFGAPPHAGMAPGVDRMIMLLRNEENIREVIAFPMNGNAQDLMCGAPGEITEHQLREVHIKIRD